VPAARKPRSRPAVLALPKRRVLVPIRIARFLPSGRSLLIGFGLLGLAVGGYVLARETSMFAVRQMEVTGARPGVVRRVDEALAPLAGQSLLSVDAAAIDARLQQLPDVSLLSYDRDFPHTARIVVSAERPVAVLRRGTDAWLVTERGRVLRRVDDPAALSLPRIWVADSSVPSEGALLADDAGLGPALALGRVLTANPRVFAEVGQVREVEGELALVLRGGQEIRLGDAEDIPLQLAVAQRVLDLVEWQAHYVDVSVPERAVVG
jgi:cell division protein FtsQ